MRQVPARPIKPARAVHGMKALPGQGGLRRRGPRHGRRVAGPRRPPLLGAGRALQQILPALAPQRRRFAPVKVGVVVLSSRGARWLGPTRAAGEDVNGAPSARRPRQTHRRCRRARVHPAQNRARRVAASAAISPGPLGFLSVSASTWIPAPCLAGGRPGGSLGAGCQGPAASVTLACRCCQAGPFPAPSPDPKTH